MGISTETSNHSAEVVATLFRKAAVDNHTYVAAVASNHSYIERIAASQFVERLQRRLEGTFRLDPSADKSQETAEKLRLGCIAAMMHFRPEINASFAEFVDRAAVLSLWADISELKAVVAKGVTTEQIAPPGLAQYEAFRQTSIERISARAGRRLSDADSRTNQILSAVCLDSLPVAAVHRRHPEIPVVSIYKALHFLQNEVPGLLPDIFDPHNNTALISRRVPDPRYGGRIQELLGGGNTYAKQEWHVIVVENPAHMRRLQEYALSQVGPHFLDHARVLLPDLPDEIAKKCMTFAARNAIEIYEPSGSSLKACLMRALPSALFMQAANWSASETGHYAKTLEGRLPGERELQETLKSYDESQRRQFTAYFIDGLSFAEIARREVTSPDAVQQMLVQMVKKEFPLWAASLAEPVPSRIPVATVGRQKTQPELAVIQVPKISLPRVDAAQVVKRLEAGNVSAEEHPQLVADFGEALLQHYSKLVERALKLHARTFANVNCEVAKEGALLGLRRVLSDPQALGTSWKAKVREAITMGLWESDPARVNGEVPGKRQFENILKKLDGVDAETRDLFVARFGRGASAEEILREVMKGSSYSNMYRKLALGVNIAKGLSAPRKSSPKINQAPLEASLALASESAEPVGQNSSAAAPAEDLLQRLNRSDAKVAGILRRIKERVGATIAEPEVDVEGPAPIVRAPKKAEVLRVAEPIIQSLIARDQIKPWYHSEALQRALMIAREEKRADKEFLDFGLRVLYGRIPLDLPQEYSGKWWVRAKQAYLDSLLETDALLENLLDRVSGISGASKGDEVWNGLVPAVLSFFPLDGELGAYVERMARAERRYRKRNE